MTTITLRAQGTATAVVAWERYADLSLWPTWSPQIRSVEAGADRLAPGLRGTVRPIVGPGVNFVIDAVDEAAMTWTWTVRVPVIGQRLRLHHSLSASSEDDAATETSLTISGFAPVVAGYAPLALLALRRLVS